MKKSKKFFTKNRKKDETFLSTEDANKFFDEQRTLSKELRSDIGISLYPFDINLDFTINLRYTIEEKKRQNIRTKGKTVNLIGLFSRVIVLGIRTSGRYTSCSVGDFLIEKKICKKQKGHYKRLYYEIHDKKLFDFFENRGYKKQFLYPESLDRVSFTKSINNEEEANQNYDDIYEFDRTYNSKNISSRNIIFEKISKF